MVPKLALLASLILIGSTANAATPAVVVPNAPSDRGYAGMGVAVLVSRSTAIGATGEGAMRIATTPLLIRGMMAGGSMQDWFEPRTYHILEARLGVEADACTPTQRACVFTGVDLGYLEDSFTSTESDAGVYLQPPGHRFTVLPRVGFELGGSMIRLRIALEYGQDAAGSSSR